MTSLATWPFYAFVALVLALSLPVTFVVWLVTLPFDRHHMAASRALRFCGEVLTRAFPFWHVDVEGALPPRPQTFVVVPNHRSLVDALAVARLPRNMKWLGKEEAFRIPWLGWAFHLAGYVPVDRADKVSGSAALGRLRAYLAEGVPVGLFAEGTRSRDGTLRAFRPGPFKLAVDTGVPIVPVAITGAGRALPAGSLRVQRSRLRVRILPPIPTAGMRVEDVDRLREETRTRIAAALAEMEGTAGPTPSGSDRPR